MGLSYASLEAAPHYTTESHLNKLLPGLALLQRNHPWLPMPIKTKSHVISRPLHWCGAWKMPCSEPASSNLPIFQPNPVCDCQEKYPHDLVYTEKSIGNIDRDIINL